MAFDQGVQSGLLVHRSPRRLMPSCRVQRSLLPLPVFDTCMPAPCVVMLSRFSGSLVFFLLFVDASGALLSSKRRPKLGFLRWLVEFVFSSSVYVSQGGVQLKPPGGSADTGTNWPPDPCWLGESYFETNSAAEKNGLWRCRSSCRSPLVLLLLLLPLLLLFTSTFNYSITLVLII